jgi:pimeloyl-ACP methyl ester carboxylesterase
VTVPVGERRLDVLVSGPSGGDTLVFHYGTLPRHSRGGGVNARSIADREYLLSGYAEWIASMFREGFSAGGDGFADDFLAFFSPWGFSLADTRQVRIWHGTDDQNVPIAHAYRLAAEMPDAEIHVPDGDGHVSIMKYFRAIVDDLISRSSVRLLR